MDLKFGLCKFFAEAVEKDLLHQEQKIFRKEQHVDKRERERERERERDRETETETERQR